MLGGYSPTVDYFAYQYDNFTYENTKKRMDEDLKRAQAEGRKTLRPLEEMKTEARAEAETQVEDLLYSFRSHFIIGSLVLYALVLAGIAGLRAIDKAPFQNEPEDPLNIREKLR